MCWQAKLELVTGAAWTSQIIELYSKDDLFLCRLDNNDALIGSYPIDDNMRLHVSIANAPFNSLASSFNEMLMNIKITEQQRWRQKKVQ